MQTDFALGFKSKSRYKDLNTILEMAREYPVPLPAMSVARELFGAWLAAGQGDLNHCAVIPVLEELAGAAALKGKA